MKHSKKIWMISTAIIAWFALIVQFYLILQTGEVTSYSTIKIITNFFSYFTILCNILVAVCVTTLLVSPVQGSASFFSKTSVQTAIAVYIFIVGLVYNLVLRGLFVLTGLHWLVDNLLHVVVPLLFVVYWIIYTPKKVLHYKNILPWLLFPAIYLIYSLIRGLVANWYPYPFLNTDKLGYGKVAVNSLFVLLAFVIVGAGMVAYNRYTKKETTA